MFEVAEVGNKVDKKTYKQEVPGLRAELLRAQRQLAAGDFAVVVLVGGVEGAGKPETVNLLYEWLDARGIETHAMWEPTDEEAARPPMWRFWRALPARGRMAVFVGSWYTQPILDRAFGRTGQADFERAMARNAVFERMLFAEGILVVKFWLHLSPAEQRARLQALEGDPQRKWKVTKLDKKLVGMTDTLRPVCEFALRRTNTAEAPWHLVEATDRRYKNLTVGRTLLDAIRHRAGEAGLAAPRPAPQPVRLHPPGRNVLNQLDMTLTLGQKKYKKDLKKWQNRLGLLSRRLFRRREHALVLVFEGPDAAGKGGAIRRLTAALDARDYQHVTIAAPSDEELARPYLWRFWRRLPARGRVAIFDRSWYGRVLVERIEGFCTTEEWQRAYAEINAFEEQLVAAGTAVVKFWIAVSPEEQLRRFEQREDTPYKQYKLTKEDWRNRDKWESYEAAACEMFEKTSTEQAPWVLVEGDNKEWARIQVIKEVVRKLREVAGSGK